MTQIVLTAEQAAVLATSDQPVAVVRPDGSHVGWVSPTVNFVIPKENPFTPEEIAAAEQEASGPGPWYTTQEVLDHLRSLDPPQP
jgi:hypothetical protein